MDRFIILISLSIHSSLYSPINSSADCPSKEQASQFVLGTNHRVRSKDRAAIRAIIRITNLTLFPYSFISSCNSSILIKSLCLVPFNQTLVVGIRIIKVCDVYYNILFKIGYGQSALELNRTFVAGIVL